MQKLLTDLSGRISQLERRVDKVDSVERKVDFLQEKITDLEDKSRRSNLIVFDINENPSETAETLKKDVLAYLFVNKLQVPCHSVGRIHRIGKHGSQRPGIVFFQDYNEKEKNIKKRAQTQRI